MSPALPYVRQKQRAIDAESKRNRRKARLAQGLCAECGKEPVRPGQKQGDLCAVKNAARVLKINQTRRKAGCCPHCGDRIKETQTACGYCRGKAQEANRRWKDKVLAAGICVCCGERPHRAERVTCAECASRAVKTERRWRLRKRRAAEFRTMFRANPDAVADRFGRLMRGHGDGQAMREAGD